MSGNKPGGERDANRNVNLVAKRSRVRNSTGSRHVRNHNRVGAVTTRVPKMQVLVNQVTNGVVTVKGVGRFTVALVGLGSVSKNIRIGSE